MDQRSASAVKKNKNAIVPYIYLFYQFKTSHRIFQTTKKTKKVHDLYLYNDFYEKLSMIKTSLKLSKKLN